MATTYSVKAVLSAVDRGFSATMKGALGMTGKLDKKMSSFATGMLQGAGQQAFGMLADGAAGLVGEINSSNKAWKTFDGNMKIIYGDSQKTQNKINSVKDTLQEYATATIYSSSDMATTYSQLAAVGVKSADKLVTGFGGLAAAAEDPTQAMKTLSQQATQMAGKPTVAWEDFKLMMEQTPAGMAAIAKSMGMTTKELVAQVQDGTLATDEFFKHVQKVGNNKGFKNLAMQYKSVDEAMDGLQETLGTKLTPAFDVLANTGIKAIEGIISKVDEIDADNLADNVSGWIKDAQPYWNSFKKVLSVTATVIKQVGGFLLEHSGILSKGIPMVLGMVAAYKGFKVVNSVVGGVKSFADSISTMAGNTGSKVAENLNKTATAQSNAGKVSQVSSAQMLGAAKSFMILGAGVLMVAAGFGILAYSAIQLASAGPLAIGVMAGLVVGLVAVGAGMGLLLKILAPMSAQMMPVAAAMLAFGAAVALVGVGILLASTGLTLLAGKLPIIAAYGMQAGGAIAALGTSMMVFATGALLAGSACLVLGAGLLVAGAGMIVLGAGVAVAAAGMLLMKVALIAVNSSLKSIAKNAKSTQKSLEGMRSSVSIVGSGLDALGNKARSAMNRLLSTFNNTANKAKSAGRKVGIGYSDGLKGGLKSATTEARTTTKQINSILRSGRADAYSAGAYISQGFAAGMQSQLGTIRSAANEMVKAADKAVKAKAKIHSPSRLFAVLGGYVGKGFANGIEKMRNTVTTAAEKLVSIPTISVPDIAMAYGGSLSDAYNYSSTVEYTINVPLEIDGKEVARVTAPYTEAELSKRQTRADRKRGVR